MKKDTAASPKPTELVMDIDIEMASIAGKSDDEIRAVVASLEAERTAVGR